MIGRRITLALMASVSLFAALLPGRSFAENDALEPPAPRSEEVEFVIPKAEKNETLLQQISDTYRTVKKRARIKSFKGKCGRYVCMQLVALGINENYIGCNGNRAYDIYCKKEQSTGGYAIHAYGAKKYTLENALKAIESEDAHARNILVGFQKGTSKAGKKYGHTLFIHGIENGMVYFSDSFAQTVDGVRYKEGAPIVCSIERFAKLYRKYQLDGVIWFT